MKITKQGTLPDDRIWRGRCFQCNSEAEATQSEMTNITHDQREGGSFSREKCPVCKAGESGFGGMVFYPKKGE